MEGPIFVIPKKALRYYGKSGISSIFYRIVCGSFTMRMTCENSQWCIQHRQQPLIAVEGYFLHITAWMFAVFIIVDRINNTCSFRLPCPNSLIYYRDFACAFLFLFLFLLRRGAFVLIERNAANYRLTYFDEMTRQAESHTYFRADKMR